MYDNVCESKIILIIFLKEKKITHGTSVIGTTAVHEILESGQLIGAPVVTSL